MGQPIQLVVIGDIKMKFIFYVCVLVALLCMGITMANAKGSPSNPNVLPENHNLTYEHSWRTESYGKTDFFHLREVLDDLSKPPSERTILPPGTKDVNMNFQPADSFSMVAKQIIAHLKDLEEPTVDELLESHGVYLANLLKPYLNEAQMATSVSLLDGKKVTTNVDEKEETLSKLFRIIWKYDGITETLLNDNPNLPYEFVHLMAKHRVPVSKIVRLFDTLLALPVYDNSISDEVTHKIQTDANSLFLYVCYHFGCQELSIGA